MEDKVKLKCKVCGDIFYVRKSYEKRYSSCSKKECRIKNKKSTALKNLGDKIYKKGHKSSPEVLKKAREGAKEWHKNNPNSIQSKKLIKRNKENNAMNNKETRRKISGDRSVNWKGDDYPRINYRGSEWKYIRLEILERDNFKCKNCSSKQQLIIHHKESYHVNKNNSLKNLITLCRSCHSKEHHQLNKKSTNCGKER